ncbi:hypothetical protein DA102_016015 [Sinorhizobium meliloti]|nr:hypothetical protein C3L21_18635 [Sinorhizobium meliloti]RMI23814.1 hypothetical protein DA102_016015 [Sinorhizobium meliloti]
MPLTLTLSPQAGRGDVRRRDGGEWLPRVPSPRLRGEGGGSRMRGPIADTAPEARDFEDM